MLEHQRKLKREAKRNPARAKKLSKDPGIPNLAPLKAQLMKQVGDDVSRRTACVNVAPAACVAVRWWWRSCVSRVGGV
jgi:hypothetical protein